MSRHLHIPNFIAHLIGLSDRSEVEKEWREAIHRSPNVAQESVQALRNAQKVLDKSINISDKIIKDGKREKSEQLKTAEEAMNLLEKSKR